MGTDSADRQCCPETAANGPERQQLRDFDLNPRQVFNTIRIFPEKPANAPWRWHFLNDFEIIQQVYEIEVDTIPDEPPLTLRDLLGKPPKR